MVWAWGQFLDHDVTATPSSGQPDSNIAVPAGDRAAAVTALLEAFGHNTGNYDSSYGGIASEAGVAMP